MSRTTTADPALIPDIEAFEERVAIHIHEGGAVRRPQLTAEPRALRRAAGARSAGADTLLAANVRRATWEWALDIVATRAVDLDADAPLVALGAVDALPVHEPEPLAPSHHHDDAAHDDAKHGSVLDGLRELELDLEALGLRAGHAERAGARATVRAIAFERRGARRAHVVRSGRVCRR